MENEKILKKILKTKKNKYKHFTLQDLITYR